MALVKITLKGFEEWLDDLIAQSPRGFFRFRRPWKRLKKGNENPRNEHPIEMYVCKTLGGDVNRDVGVSSSDAASVKQRLGQAVDAGNFLFDVNADGAISSADAASVKQRLGNVAPSCP